MKNPLIIIGAFMVLLTACSPLVEQLKEQGIEVEVTEESEEMNNEQEVVEESEENKDGGSYGMYQEGVIGQGEQVVLFFHATWCPKCKQNDALLTKWYGEAEVPLSTYRVDYDTADDLKQKYGIVQQDTFLLLDASGNELKRVSFPPETDLKRLVYGNVNAAQGS